MRGQQEKTVGPLQNSSLLMKVNRMQPVVGCVSVGSALAHYGGWWHVSLGLAHSMWGGTSVVGGGGMALSHPCAPLQSLLDLYRSRSI